MVPPQAAGIMPVVNSPVYMEASSLDMHIQKASALVEALPYMQNFRGQIFLIKVGGSAMEDPELVRNLMRDIVFLEVVGINPVIVHGGGKAISAAMAGQGLEPVWVSGLRVTDAAAIEVVERTLSEVINPQLVGLLEKHGGRSAGLPGTEVFIGRRLDGRAEDGSVVDLGFVGEVVECRLDRIREWVSEEIVPVVSPLASEADTGQPLNVNADIAAAALARSLKVSKLIYLSDVRGVMRDIHNPDSLVQSISRAGVEGLIADKVIVGGMIPKVRSALEALDAGVGKVHLIDGRIPHSLLLEIFTNVGIGTEILA